MVGARNRMPAEARRALALLWGRRAQRACEGQYQPLSPHQTLFMNEGLKGGQVTIQCADSTRQSELHRILPVWT
jgi:hypothetical protein